MIDDCDGRCHDDDNTGAIFAHRAADRRVIPERNHRIRPDPLPRVAAAVRAVGGDRVRHHLAGRTVGQLRVASVSESADSVSFASLTLIVFAVSRSGLFAGRANSCRRVSIMCWTCSPEIA